MTDPKQPSTPPKSRGSRERPKDERAPLAQALGTAYELLSIAIVMAIIPLGGYWLDKKLHTNHLFLIVGCVLGVSLGFYQLMRFTSKMRK